ncbi:MAG TPA: branched-chain amino acid transaminase [Terracidiphilus sp.]|nr:branched-chain amino acid transaminase [Terracidiphilus sp.]
MKADADPNLICYFDGQYIPMREARIGILTHALHYGTGVFEGIRAYWNEAQEELYILRPTEHYRRWKQNCGILHIDIPHSPEDLCSITAELARRNHFRTDLYIRPLAYKSAERIGVAIDDQDAFFIAAVPYGEYLHSENGLHAGVSSWRRIEDNAIPPRAKICGAYANSALAGDEARRSGFDEAILLNESGHVTEGATCNLFMLRKGRLITPAVTDNILEGITRDFIRELAAHELGIETEERPIARSELYVCDELFLTGTAVGLAPVVRVDHRPIASGAIGEVTHRLRQLYFDATHGRLPAYRKWLLPVYGGPSPHEQCAEQAPLTSVA